MQVKDYKKILKDSIEELSKFNDEEPILPLKDEDGQWIYLIGEERVLEHSELHFESIERYSKLLNDMVKIVEKALIESDKGNDIYFPHKDIEVLKKANLLLGISIDNKNY